MITFEESRYARQELITWWDQDMLGNSRVLVVGAGALGSEIVKNLALLGVGHIDIVDMDRIERSNLARSAMFRDRDEGHFKADVLAAAAMDLNPDVRATAINKSVMTLGLGYVKDFDLVIAGLDNREARLWIAQTTRKVGLPWIDGAIEGLRGLARVFLTEGACYECTLGEVDRKIMSARKACSLLSADEMMIEGKVPTNSTSAAIIAGIQVQEAVKLLVGREDLLALRNEAFIYTGDTLDSYKSGYTEDEWCPTHDHYEDLHEWTAEDGKALTDLLDDVDLVGITAVDFEPEMVLSRHCLSCDWADATVWPLPQLGAGDGKCPECGELLSLDVGRSFKTDDPIMKMPVSELGLPVDDVITLRADMDRHHYIIRSST